MTITDEYPTVPLASLYRNDRPARPVPDLAALDDDAVLEQYDRDGFLAVTAGVPATEVDAALRGLDEVAADPQPGTMIEFEAWADPEAGDRDRRLDGVRKLMSFTQHHEGLRALAGSPAVVGAVRRLLRTDHVRLFQDMALLKPPGGGREKPWHQDKAFFNLDLDAPVVGVWIALDPATPANGCMHVIAGSHRDGAAPHFARRDWQVCDNQVDLTRDTVVPLDPGGLLFFDGYLQHGTPPNHTDSRRRAVQFHYAPADIAAIPEEDRMAVFGWEGRGVQC